MTAYDSKRAGHALDDPLNDRSDQYAGSTSRIGRYGFEITPKEKDSVLAPQAWALVPSTLDMLHNTRAHAISTADIAKVMCLRIERVFSRSS